MVELKSEKVKDYTYVYGYNIEEENPEDFEMFVKVYTDNNKWNKKDVLCDVQIIRCSLFSLLKKVYCAQETLEEIIQGNFENFVNLKDVIKELPEYEDIQISLPYRVRLMDRGCPDGFRSYKSSFYPVTVTIAPHEYSDFSRLFQDFDVYQEKAIDEALKVFNEVKTTYKLNTNDAEKKILKNIELREELKF